MALPRPVQLKPPELLYCSHVHTQTGYKWFNYTSLTLLRCDWYTVHIIGFFQIVCPWSFVYFYTVSCYINMDKTSWTCSSMHGRIRMTLRLKITKDIMSFRQHIIYIYKSSWLVLKETFNIFTFFKEKETYFDTDKNFLFIYLLRLI